MKGAVLNTFLYNWLKFFLAALKEKGLSVSPDTHLQLVRVLSNCADDITSKNILDYLAPIIVKNTQQLQLLKDVYHTFLENQFPPVTDSLPPPPPLPPPGPKIKKYLLLLILLPVAAIIYYIISHSFPLEISVKTIATHDRNVNTPVQFDASGSFTNLADTQHVRFDWKFGDGSTDSVNYRLEHLYKKPGRYEASLKLSARNPGVKILHADTIHQLTIGPPPLSIEADVQGEIETGQLVRFKINHDSLYPPSERNVLLINDTIAARNSYSFPYTFDKPGHYTIQFTGDDSTDLEFPEVAVTQVTVKKSQGVFLATKVSGSLANAASTRISKTWLWTLILLTVAPLLLLSWLQWIAFKKNRQSKINAKEIIDRFDGREKPFEITFRNHDELIETEKDLLEVAKNYKRRSADAVVYLDVHQTITSTIRADGFIQPVWTSKTRPVEFLFLIDSNKIKNQQIKLFEYLLKKFSSNDLYLEKFYFLFDPDVCTNTYYPNGIHVSKLYDLYPNHVLIIFGNGYQFIDKRYPSLNEDLFGFFKRWDQWGICTPVNIADWDHKEEILQQATTLFPADVKGQLLLFKIFENRARGFIETLTGVDLYRTGSFDFNEADQVKKYLNDDFLFQWICAIAIYPRVQWEVLVSIGDALTNTNYTDRSLNYSLLLKLVRIKWMQDGSFPDMLRLELLKRLEPRNEIVARETMIRLMDEASRRMDENSFSYEELYMQRTTDKFLLYSTDPLHEEYKNYESAHAEFKSLWEQGKILDSPLSAYLRKETDGESWSTLIGNARLSNVAKAGIPMNLFFKDGLQAGRKRNRITALILLAISSVAIILLLAILPFVKLLRNSKLDRTLHFTSYENTVPVTFRIVLNDCLDSARMMRDFTSVVFETPDGQSRVLNASNPDYTQQFDIEKLTDQSLKVKVNSNNQDYQLEGDYSPTGSVISFLMEGCPSLLPVCTDWVPIDNAPDSTYMRMSLFDISMLKGGQPEYEPVSLLVGGKKLGFLNGKEIVAAYSCSSNNDINKLILRNSENNFQVAYYRDGAKSNMPEFGIGIGSFKSLDKAARDTSRPLLVSKILLPELNEIKLVQNINSLDAYQGNWVDGQNNFSILSGRQVHYQNKQWDIVNMQGWKENGITAYKLALTNTSRKSESGNLFICTISPTEIAINEKMYSTAALLSERPVFGKLTSFIRGGESKPSLAILPSSVKEIWSGNSNKVLLKIDQNGGKLYYKGPKQAYNKSDDVYDLVETYKLATGAYKVICKSSAGYSAFLLLNISPQSFKLAHCKTYSSKSELEKATQDDCDDYTLMKLYYKKDPDKLFLPLHNQDFAESESMKIIELIKKSEAENGIFSVDSMLVYTVSPNESRESLQTRLKEIRKITPLKQIDDATWTISNYSYQPFDRDYVVMVAKKSNKNDVIDNNPVQQNITPIAKRKKILWVDDNPRNNISLVKKLRVDSWIITEVSTNAAALRLLKNESFDVIISDIDRTKEGPTAGLTLIDSVQAISKIPFLIYSSSSGKGTNTSVIAAKGAHLSNTEQELLEYLGSLFRKTDIQSNY